MVRMRRKNDANDPPRSKPNFVDFDVVRLAHGIGDGAGERVGRDPDLRIEFSIRSAAAGSDIGNSSVPQSACFVEMTVVRIL
jgi:hypothetical protein